MPAGTEHSSATQATASTSHPSSAHHRFKVLFFKVLHGLSQRFQNKINQLIIQDEDCGQQLCSSGIMELFTTRVKLVCAGDTAFSGATVRLWNEFPRVLRAVTNLTTFHSKHKGHFLDLLLQYQHRAECTFKKKCPKPNRTKTKLHSTHNSPRGESELHKTDVNQVT